MDKTHLEKRIEEKAIERFEKDYREFVNYVKNHPVGKHLKIKIGNKEIPVAYFGVNYALFNEKQDENKRSEHTNYEKVKKEIIQEYIKQETDKVIDQLSNIGYLFN